MRAALFTEEGRVARAGRRLLMFFAIFWLVVSVAGGYLSFRYYTRANMTMLQKLYLPAYFHSAWRSHVPFNPKSEYWLLVRYVANPKTGHDAELLCRDEEVVAILDDDGRIHITEQGIPDIRLKQSYFEQSKKFAWDRKKLDDGYAYTLLREHVYGGDDAYKLFYPSLLAVGLIFFPGMIGGSIVKRQITRRYLRGRQLRGTRELTPKEYARIHRKDTGIGLEVLQFKKGR